MLNQDRNNVSVTWDSWSWSISSSKSTLKLGDKTLLRCPFDREVLGSFPWLFGALEVDADLEFLFVSLLLKLLSESNKVSDN